MSEGILVECKCGAKYEVDPQHTGMSFECESCGQDLMVPTIEWNRRYRKIVGLLNHESEHERARGYDALASLGSPNGIPRLAQGLYDSDRLVVNTCLIGLLRIGRSGRTQLLEMMKEDIFGVGRLHSAIRELQYWDGIMVLCDLIDSGQFTENQVSETIHLLGEVGRDKLHGDYSRDLIIKERCVNTLKHLRKAYPNLAMLVDNALSNFKRFDSQVSRIPDDAKVIRGGKVESLDEFAATSVRRRKGCATLILAMALPLAALALYLAR